MFNYDWGKENLALHLWVLELAAGQAPDTGTNVYVTGEPDTICGFQKSSALSAHRDLRSEVDF